jgi:hypothetical protein
MRKKFIVLCEGDNDQYFASLFAERLNLLCYLPDRAKIASGRHGETSVIREFLHNIGEYKKLDTLIKDEGGKSNCLSAFEELFNDFYGDGVEIRAILDDDNNRCRLEDKLKRLSPTTYKQLGRNLYLVKNRYKVLLIPKSLEWWINKEIGVNIHNRLTPVEKNNIIREFTKKQSVNWFKELRTLFR